VWFRVMVTSWRIESGESRVTRKETAGIDDGAVAERFIARPTANGPAEGRIHKIMLAYMKGIWFSAGDLGFSTCHAFELRG